MGIVYEALTKAERERKPEQAETAAGRSDRRPGDDRRPEAEDFDFVRYSLNSPAASELRRMQRERDTAARQKATLDKPACEVQVSVSQIDPHLVTFYEADPAAAGEYARLAGSLIGMSLERDIKRLLIASGRHGDGRSLVALNLACALAQARKKVLLVDTDLERPSILRLLGIGAQVGLTELVEHGLPPAAASIKVLPYGFVVLPTRERRDNPAELLALPEFREMLNDLEPEYDFMLFDSPPLPDSKGGELLLSLTNAVLLVIRAEKTSSANLGRAIAPLDEDRVVAVALNRMASRAAIRM
jgi:Mrp family chromosome partitioning ATPase